MVSLAQLNFILGWMAECPSESFPSGKDCGEDWLVREEF